MAINKVAYGDQTLLDLTEDTVTADKVLEGETFHDKSGVLRYGNLVIPVQDVEVNGESVVDPTTKIAKITSSWVDIQGTLLAGNTSVTLNNPSIKNTSNFEFFTDVFGVCPTNVLVSNGSITLTFDAQANDLGVKVRVTNTGAVSPYTFKNYLEVGNTAGAYINTGLNIATTQEFEVKFQLTDTQSNNVVYFGCWQSYKDTMIYYYAGGFGCGVGGTMTPRHNFDTDIHVYKAMQDAIYLDDVQDGNANWTNAPTNVPYYLFKDPDHSGAINIRIYYAKIWDNRTLIRDFIPAVRNDDGVIGMYDQVNDVFYTNDGAGSFITD